MNLTCRILIVLFLIFSVGRSYGQDSTQRYALPEFRFSAKPELMFDAVNTQQLDSSILNRYSTDNIAVVLSENSAATIRSYGVAGISSVSLRGGNANHTAVIWNGFNLQDPLNGGFNFAQSSSNLIDNISIQYGGGSTVYGSGAVGGVILLDNQAAFNRPFTATALARTGSFGMQGYQLQFGHGTKKISTRLRLFHHQINNDFEFENVASIGHPTQKYLNAYMKQQGLLYEFYYRPASNQVLGSQLWLQSNFREIPGNMTIAYQEDLEEHQHDDWLRWGLNWKKTGAKVNYEARTGIFYNRSTYVNSLIDLTSHNNSFKNTTEVMGTVRLLKKNQASLGIINQYTVGLSDNFNNNPTLNSSAIYLAPSFKFGKKVTLNTSIREEWYNGSLTPLTYALNGKYLFYKNWYLCTGFSKNYKTPNFNDLYWNGAFASGNKNLESEHGYSGDVGLGIKQHRNKLSLQHEVTFFQSSIQNQIQWIAAGSNWSPRNVKQVDTKGVELKSATTWSITSKTALTFRLNYAYTDARVTEKSPEESNDVLDKQLTYIPYYQGNTYLGLEIGNILIDMNVQYVGYQFTRSDNLEWLDAYTLTGAGLQYTFKKHDFKTSLFGKMNNIFNTVYEVRQWYPMPRMNYEIGIKLTFK
ncbi:MAG: TonB-dependent receptor plug domain-containing protein [Flavobacteriales bacterium]|nr:TonB-dependent receptor plug domain-containing protein [Flavobacteriales bacterium]